MSDSIFKDLTVKNANELDKLKQQFNVVFIEKVNHGYDKSLNNTMFHWELNKLFGMQGDELFRFAEANDVKLTFTRGSMNRFIRGLSNQTSVVIVEQDMSFTTLYHANYDVPETEDKENTELF